MEEHEPNLITLDLSRYSTRDGITVELCIYPLETKPGWSLEVLNSEGISIVWDGLFPSDEAANQEFFRIVADEGMASFLDGEKVVPFRR